MASWESDIVTAVTNLGGTASYEEIYAEIQRIRVRLPSSWKKVIQRRIQDLSSDSQGFKNGKDLFFSVNGKGAGVWGLRSLTADTPKALDFSSGNLFPKQLRTQSYRILRDTKLARQLKLVHRDRCQICGVAIALSDDATYSEAHHIKPLGAPHHGPDVPSNILVLCPVHHVLCDYGAIVLDISELRTVVGHSIDSEFINYHNMVVASGKR